MARRKKQKVPYKAPTIIRCKDGDWYIQYYYENPQAPGKWEPFKVRDGLNYIKDPILKELEYRDLRTDVEDWLKEGNSPFDAQAETDDQALAQITEELKLIEAAGVKFFTLADACIKFMDYCRWKNLSERTITGYQTFVNAFNEWINSTATSDFEARKYNRKHLLTFLNVYNDQEDWTARTYNNYLDFFQTFFTRVHKIEKEELLEHDIDVVYRMDLTDVERKNDTAEKNRAYTPQVAELVRNELRKNGDQNLIDFVEWIFHSCMRPKEIQLLKVQHINVQTRQIKVIGPTGKTGERTVPISHELEQLIKSRNLLKGNPNNYVFGNSGAPGVIAFNKNYFATRYLKVKDTLGLDRNYTMYGWKHTAVIMMILAGFTDEEIMLRTGHRDIESFKAYKRDLLLFIETNNLDMKRMQGKTVSFW